MEFLIIPFLFGWLNSILFFLFAAYLFKKYCYVLVCDAYKKDLATEPLMDAQIDFAQKETDFIRCQGLASKQECERLGKTISLWRQRVFDQNSKTEVLYEENRERASSAQRTKTENMQRSCFLYVVKQETIKKIEGSIQSHFDQQIVKEKYLDEILIHIERKQV